MVVLLLVSCCIGIALTEIAARLLSHPWAHGQFKIIRALLRDFLAARDDETRQALALRSGWITLRLSLASFLLLALMAGLAFLSPWILSWSSTQQESYLIATSVIASLWWFLRLRLCPRTRSH